ncbi:MAG TPA: helix-turn-helix domain-containing protein [Thermoanaerobaculia bacterium]|nr:helix-turn-helix domain-containing protein [Thermoanaerobaculia bacterium]
MTQLRFKLGGYFEFEPAVPLQRYVQASWIHASAIGAAPAIHRVIPDPCLSVAFGCRRDANGRVQDPRLWFVGPVRFPRFTAQHPGSELVAVRLFPEWSEHFLDIDPGEHPNAIVNLAEVSDGLERDLLDRLTQTRSARTALELLLSAFTRRARARRPPNDRQSVACNASTLLRRSGGRMAMDRLAAVLGITARHLHRTCTSLVGLSPKALARTLRFQRALLAADAVPRPDWSDLAARFGYADQAHMIREFKELTGLTPRALHRERRSESDSFNLS